MADFTQCNFAFSEFPMLSLTDNINKIESIDTENLRNLWALFTKCGPNLQHGRRLENLSWRLWYRESSLKDACTDTDTLNSVPDLSSSVETLNCNAMHCSTSSSSDQSTTSASISSSTSNEEGQNKLAKVSGRITTGKFQELIQGLSSVSEIPHVSSEGAISSLAEKSTIENEKQQTYSKTFDAAQIGITNNDIHETKCKFTENEELKDQATTAQNSFVQNEDNRIMRFNALNFIPSSDCSSCDMEDSSSPESEWDSLNSKTVSPSNSVSFQKISTKMRSSKKSLLSTLLVSKHTQFTHDTTTISIPSESINNAEKGDSILKLESLNCNVLSPRATRRHMLSSELSESLRRNLLWERYLKNITVTCASKRSHNLEDEAPHWNIEKEGSFCTTENNECNDIFDAHEEYYDKGW